LLNIVTQPAAYCQQPTAYSLQSRNQEAKKMYANMMNVDKKINDIKFETTDCDSFDGFEGMKISNNGIGKGGNKRGREEVNMEEMVRKQILSSDDAKKLLEHTEFVEWIETEFDLEGGLTEDDGVYWKSKGDDEGEWEEYTELEMADWLDSIPEPNIQIFQTFLNKKDRKRLSSGKTLFWEKYHPNDVLGPCMLQHMMFEYCNRKSQRMSNH
jgi:hypothetical protein